MGRLGAERLGGERDGVRSKWGGREMMGREEVKVEGRKEAKRERVRGREGEGE